jgi:hypothetical protein
MKQVLLIAIRMGNGEGRGQPVVLRDQPRQQLGPVSRISASLRVALTSSARLVTQATQARNARAWRWRQALRGMGERGHGIRLRPRGEGMT